jgi:hypothetical protein
VSRLAKCTGSGFYRQRASALQPQWIATASTATKVKLVAFNISVLLVVVLAVFIFKDWN